MRSAGRLARVSALALAAGIAPAWAGPLDGAGPADAFGSALARADMNADDVPDLVIGAPLADVDGMRDAGLVRIVSGADGSVLGSFTGSEAGERLGSALAVVPDRNSDDVPDLLVGSPLYDVTATIDGKTITRRDAGRVALHSGADGMRLEVLFEGFLAGNRAGSALAVGDLDGDGDSEVVVGIPGFFGIGPNDELFLGAGMALVFSDLSLTLTDYGRTGTQTGERSGTSVAIDTVQHRLLVGSPAWDAATPTKRTDVGRVTIYAGTFSPTEPLASIEGQQKGERFGASLASFGTDLDGDGAVDWAAGAPGADVPGSAGKLRKDAGRVRVFSAAEAGSVYELDGAAAGDAFGASLAATPAGALFAGAPGREVTQGESVLKNAGSVSTQEGVACAMRTSADRPDDQPGLYQMRVWYVVPSDGLDLRRDLDGSIRTSVEAFTGWMEAETEGRAFRIDRCDGEVDIGFARLAETDAELNTGDTLTNLGAAMLADGLLEDDQTINLVYYEGTNDTCGNASNPSLPGQFSLGVVYLNGAYPDPNVLPCNQNPLGASILDPGYLDLVMLHEAFHQAGAVPSCAPHHANNHVNDDPTDLMYAGPLPGTQGAIDPGRDDYFDTGSTTCRDLGKSVFLEPLPAGAVAPPNW